MPTRAPHHPFLTPEPATTQSLTPSEPHKMSIAMGNLISNAVAHINTGVVKAPFVNATDTAPDTAAPASPINEPSEENVQHPETKTTPNSPHTQLAMESYAERCAEESDALREADDHARLEQEDAMRMSDQYSNDEEAMFEAKYGDGLAVKREQIDSGVKEAAAKPVASASASKRAREPELIIISDSGEEGSDAPKRTKRVLTKVERHAANIARLQKTADRAQATHEKAVEALKQQHKMLGGAESNHAARRTYEDANGHGAFGDHYRPIGSTECFTASGVLYAHDYGVMDKMNTNKWNYTAAVAFHAQTVTQFFKYRTQHEAMAPEIAAEGDMYHMRVGKARPLTYERFAFVADKLLEDRITFIKKYTPQVLEGGDKEVWIELAFDTQDPLVLKWHAQSTRAVKMYMTEKILGDSAILLDYVTEQGPGAFCSTTFRTKKATKFQLDKTKVRKADLLVADSADDEESD